MKTSRDFQSVAAAVEASALFRTADRIASAIAAAMSHSATGSRLRRARIAVDRLDRIGRVRMIALAVLTVSVVHPLLLLLVPPYVAPGVPKLLWAILAAASAIVLVCAPAIVAAWPTSIVRAAIGPDR